MARQAGAPIASGYLYPSWVPPSQGCSNSRGAQTSCGCPSARQAPPTQAGALNTIGVLPALGCSEPRGVPELGSSPGGCPHLRWASPIQGCAHLRHVLCLRCTPILAGLHTRMPHTGVSPPQGYLHLRGVPTYRGALYRSDHTRVTHTRVPPPWGYPIPGCPTSGISLPQSAPPQGCPQLKGTLTLGVTPPQGCPIPGHPTSWVPPDQGYLPTSGVSQLRGASYLGAPPQS